MSKTVLSLRLALAAAAFALLLPAQQQAQPQLLHLTYIKVQPGMANEWREMQTTVNAAYRKEGTPWRHVWAGAVFSEVHFATVFPVGKMERYDTPNPMRKAMNDTQYQQYIQKASRIVASSHHRLVTTRPDLSLMSQRGAPSHAVVNTIVVEPGRNAAFEAALKADFLPAWRKAGLKDVWVHQTIFGSNPTEYVIVVLFEKWAEMEGGGPMVRALGAEGWDKIRQKLAGIATSVHAQTIRNVPELGYPVQ